MDFGNEVTDVAIPAFLVRTTLVFGNRRRLLTLVKRSAPFSVLYSFDVKYRYRPGATAKAAFVLGLLAFNATFFGTLLACVLGL